jgi:cytochrome b6
VPGRRQLAFDWFEERLEAQTLLDASATKYVPPHVGLFYCFGGLVLMALLVQFGSGLLLTFYFTPTVADACSSVALLQLRAADGWFPRSLHRWASNSVLLAILLHLCRVYLTGGFRKPRELTWISGAFLALCALA